MKMNLNNYQPFASGVERVYFSKKDKNAIMKMKGGVDVVSTVCPDYPNDGEKYTFVGRLGSGISLTAKHHLNFVPSFIEELKKLGLMVRWNVIVADLPELVDSQREFYERVAGDKKSYLEKCAQSVDCIKRHLGDDAEVATFGDFHGGIDYVDFQSEVAKRILSEAEQQPFKSKFDAFLRSRMGLAELFRGRTLTDYEKILSAAHGMSLYVSHGTLIRKKYQGRNVIVVNHATTNLQNFFLAKFVTAFEHYENTPKFPVGILDVENY